MIKFEHEIENSTLYLLRNDRATNVKYKNILNLYYVLKTNKWFNEDKRVGHFEVIEFIIFKFLPKLLGMKIKNKIEEAKLLEGMGIILPLIWLIMLGNLMCFAVIISKYYNWFSIFIMIFLVYHFIKGLIFLILQIKRSVQNDN